RPSSATGGTAALVVVVGSKVKPPSLEPKAVALVPVVAPASTLTQVVALWRHVTSPAASLPSAPGSLFLLAVTPSFRLSVNQYCTCPLVDTLSSSSRPPEYS